jgi:hypothetical protein
MPVTEFLILLTTPIGLGILLFILNVVTLKPLRDNINDVKMLMKYYFYLLITSLFIYFLITQIQKIK